MLLVYNSATKFVHCFSTACDVIKDIQWSQKLDSIFKDNYQKDPTLSWQFFGSSTGFMRQFPGNVVVYRANDGFTN